MIVLEEERAETIRMIAESATFIASREHVERARRLRGSTPGFDREIWVEAGALGWLALRVPEERGGIGLGVPELCALCEMLGRGLVPEPLPHAICLAPLLGESLLMAVISGDAVVLPAWTEALDSAARRPVRFAGGALSGEKHHVLMASGADHFVVRTPDGLALVARDAPGLTVSASPLQDGGHFGTLHFADTPAEPLAGMLDDVLEEMTLAMAAYLLGVMRHAFEITGDYLRIRHQFDRPIGSFQALQHRMADLFIQIELTAASIGQAARVIESDATPDLRQRAVSRAKARASDAAMLVTRQAIQLHGGIGYSDEADIGLFLRKALTLTNLHGSPAAHRARFGELLRAEHARNSV